MTADETQEVTEAQEVTEPAESDGSDANEE